MRCRVALRALLKFLLTYLRSEVLIIAALPTQATQGLGTDVIAMRSRRGIDGTPALFLPSAETDRTRTWGRRFIISPVVDQF